MEWRWGKMVCLIHAAWECLFSRRWFVLLIAGVVCSLAVGWFVAGPDRRVAEDVEAARGVPIPQFDWIGSVAPAGQSRIAVYGGTEVINVWAVLVYFWPESVACIVGIPAAIMLLRSFRRHGSEEVCRRCGYCLRGIGSPRCPECGTFLKRSNRVRGYRSQGAIPLAAAVTGVAMFVSVLCISWGPRSGWVADLFRWESRGLARFAQSRGYRSLGSMVQQRTGVVIIDPDHRSVGRFVRIYAPVCRIESATDDGRYCVVTVPGLSATPVAGLLDAGRAIPNPSVTLVNLDRPLPVFLGSSRVVMLTDDSRLVVWNLDLNLVETKLDLRDRLVRLWSSEALFAAYGSDGSIQVAFSSRSWPLAPVARWAPCFTCCFALTGNSVTRTADLVTPDLRDGRPVYRPNGLFLFDTAARCRRPKVTLVRGGGGEYTITSDWPVSFDGCVNDGRWVFGTDGRGDGGTRRTASPTLYLWSVPGLEMPKARDVEAEASDEYQDHCLLRLAEDPLDQAWKTQGTTFNASRFMTPPVRSSAPPVENPVPSIRRHRGSSDAPAPCDTRWTSPDGDSSPGPRLLPPP
jgi:hypothetical protein